jgi:hypothetical protein
MVATTNGTRTDKAHLFWGWGDGLDTEVIRTWKQEEFQILIMELLMQFYHTLRSKAYSWNHKQTLWRRNSVLLRYTSR